MIPKDELSETLEPLRMTAVFRRIDFILTQFLTRVLFMPNLAKSLWEALR